MDASSDDDGRMLIQDFVHVALPFDDVKSKVISDPRAILESLAVEAYRDGEALSVRIGPTGKHPGLSKEIALDIGSPYPRGSGIVFPICWWATKAAWLFPCLDGDLEISPVEDGTTRIALSGRYEPPLAAVGRGMDRIVLHHVAESSLRTFLNSMAAALKAFAPTSLPNDRIAAQSGR
jgi:hypothetical protein